MRYYLLVVSAVASFVACSACLFFSSHFLSYCCSQIQTSIKPFIDLGAAPLLCVVVQIGCTRMSDPLALATLRARTIRYVDNEIYEDAAELDGMLRAHASPLLQKDKMLFAPAAPGDNSRCVSHELLPTCFSFSLDT